MSYSLLCHSCNERSELADCLIPGMCPKCGIAINACTINRINNDSKEEPIELRPTVIKWPPKEYTEAQKEAFLDECRRLLDKYGGECQFEDPDA